MNPAPAAITAGRVTATKMKAASGEAGGTVVVLSAMGGGVTATAVVAWVCTGEGGGGRTARGCRTAVGLGARTGAGAGGAGRGGGGAAQCGWGSGGMAGGRSGGPPGPGGGGGGTRGGGGSTAQGQ